MSLFSRAVSGKSGSDPRYHKVGYSIAAGAISGSDYSGALLTIAESLYKIDERLDIRRIPPAISPTYASVFVQNQYRVDFEIPNDGINQASDFLIEMTLTNSSGADIGIPPMQFAIDHIDLLADGSNASNTYYPEQLYLIEYMEDDPVRAVYAGKNMGAENDFSLTAINGVDTLYSEESNLINGATRTYRMRFKNPFNAAKLYLPSIREKPRFAVYFSNTFQNSGAVPVVSDMNLTIIGRIFSGETKVTLDSIYTTAAVAQKVLYYNRYIKNMALTSGQRTENITLSGLSGTTHAMIMIIRDVASSGTNRYKNAGLCAVSSSTLYAPGGNLWGFEQMSTDYLRLVFPMYHSNSLFFASRTFYPFVFSSNFRATLETGIDSGSVFLNDDWNIRFTPSETFATGQINFFVIQTAEISIANGKVRLRQISDTD